MLEDYIAAGFDPAAFWTLTLRLYVVHMKGAMRRDKLARASMAEAAFVGRNCESTRDLDKYIAELTGVVTQLPPEAMAGVLHAASVGLGQINRDEFLKSLGG